MPTPSAGASSWTRWRVAGLVLLIGFGASRPAGARGQEPPPIADNDYAVELVPGPIQGSGRAIGMGGAFVAVAEGLESVLWNPAGYAARPVHSLDWFELEPVLGLAGPGSFDQDDFFNNGGDLPAESAIFLTAGLRLQLGNAGLGGLGLFQSFEVPGEAGQQTVTSVAGRFGLAHGFADGQLVVGLGVRTARVNVVLGDNTLFELLGTGIELGGVFRPERFPFRLGAAVRGPVTARPESGDAQLGPDGVRRVADFAVPDRVVRPWELQLGAAWQLGPRPLNRRWRRERDPKRELQSSLEANRCLRRQAQSVAELRAEGHPDPEGAVGSCPFLERPPESIAFWEDELARVAWEDRAFRRDLADARRRTSEARKAAVAALPRRYLLVSAELLIVGRSEDAVSLDGFLSQTARRAGRRVSVSPRVGAEAEVVPHWLKLRLGAYLEPARADDALPRFHGTMGFDLRLFTWDLFGLLDPFTFAVGGTADIARGYVNVGLGLGFWH
ncbi:MAG TPA: hypothetical protein RMF84_07670 [Polyangiaceae bacterium LLY-WYZ-14_1]|nr:hypothetical protein [Polyangiaceae bacterium LLY-WYZ-14_1]